MIELMAYKPVMRGFIMLILSGFVFPLSGVFIIRLQMLPVRFLLMHGVILGGAIALVINMDSVIVSLAVNILLLVLLNSSSQLLKTDKTQMTMFFMISSIGAASAVISRFNVPAKDTLTLLWGSLYVSDAGSIAAVLSIGCMIIVFTAVFFRQLTAVFFDREVALASGINVPVFEFLVMILIALTVAVTMRLMGALLLDAMILLPAIISGMLVSGLKKSMILSCILGGLFSLSGFFISLKFDVPVSAGVALPAVLVFAAALISGKRGKNERKN